MRRRLMRRLFLALALILAYRGGAAAGEMMSRALSGWFNVTSDNGWRGRRYMDGEHIFAEEFDSTGNGRIDIWRFYRRGVLSSEERDINHDGKVDLLTRWDERTGFLTAILLDSNKRGINDLEIEMVGNQRWEVREDRNLDGVTDRVLYLDAPADLFDRVNPELARGGDVGGAIPREYWREMWSDDGFTGSITDYYRFNRRGELTHYGEWDGRRIAWRRAPPDYVPTPSTPALTRAPGAGAPYGAGTPPAAVAPGVQYPTEPPIPTVRDPFDLAADGSDPYAGIGPARRPPPVASTPRGPAPDPYAPYGGSPGPGDTPPVIGRGASGAPVAFGPDGEGDEFGAPPVIGRGATGAPRSFRDYASDDIQTPPVVGRGAGGTPPAPADRAGTGGFDSGGRDTGGQGRGYGGGYGGLPSGESSARSVPARMRPPGASARRR